MQIDTIRAPGRSRRSAEAAGLGLAGLTAWQALVDVADVRPGQRVLVHAAAGGVGHLAVQIAKALDLDLDVVVDPIGGAYGPRSLRTLRPDGILVALASPAEAYLEDQAAREGKRARFMIVEPDAHGLAALTDLVTAGKLRVEVDTVLPLEQAARAHRLGETGRTRGKIVLTP